VEKTQNKPQFSVRKREKNVYFFLPDAKVRLYTVMKIISIIAIQNRKYHRSSHDICSHYHDWFECAL
jgi:hypothetical protein